MIRAVILVLALLLSGPVGAQSTDGTSDAETEAGEDAAPESGSAGAPEGGISDDALSVDEASPTGGVEMDRPVPASPEGTKGLENPDAEAFAEGRETNRSLLADRQSPSAYPTLEAPDDDGGALDGASTGDTLAAKVNDEDARALFTALAGMNCRIAARDVAGTLGPMGFAPETVTNTLATLYVEGAASLDAQGNLTIPSSLCPPDEPVASPRDRVISAMRDNGCTAEEDTIRSAPGVSNLSDAQLLAILGPMREQGEIDTGTGTATLSEELCGSL